MLYKVRTIQQVDIELEADDDGHAKHLLEHGYYDTVSSERIEWTQVLNVEEVEDE